MMTLPSPAPLTDKWRWSISANLYAAGPGVPEYAAYIWDESQGVEPWLPEHEGRGSFWLLDQSERPQRQLSYLRSPYYGLFRCGVVLICGASSIRCQRL